MIDSVDNTFYKMNFEFIIKSNQTLIFYFNCTIDAKSTIRLKNNNNKKRKNYTLVPSNLTKFQKIL